MDRICVAWLDAGGYDLQSYPVLPHRSRFTAQWCMARNRRLQPLTASRSSIPPTLFFSLNLTCGAWLDPATAIHDWLSSLHPVLPHQPLFITPPTTHLFEKEFIYVTNLLYLYAILVFLFVTLICYTYILPKRLPASPCLIGIICSEIHLMAI